MSDGSYTVSRYRFGFEGFVSGTRWQAELYGGARRVSAFSRRGVIRLAERELYRARERAKSREEREAW